MATPKKQHTLLIVDDSPTHRSLLKVFLSGQGFAFVEADNGLKALAALEAAAIDLAIVDINMPEMDGVTFIRRVRAAPAYAIASLPVILLTGEKDRSYIADALRAGADECLKKPVSSAGVLEMVRKLLRLGEPAK
jgi:two-component system, chemotaxis family, chemotaxis protein CheY